MIAEAFYGATVAEQASRKAALRIVKGHLSRTCDNNLALTEKNFALSMIDFLREMFSSPEDD